MTKSSRQQLSSKVQDVCGGIRYGRGAAQSLIRMQKQIVDISGRACDCGAPRGVLRRVR